MPEVTQPFSNDYLLEILSHSPVATGIYSGENVVIHAANDAMLGLWGKDRSIIGMPMGEGVPELMGQAYLGILREVFLSGKDYRGENAPAELLVDGKLQIFYFDFVYKAIKNKDGKTECILHTAADVTQRYISMRKIDLLNDDLAAVNKQLNAINAELINAQCESETQRQHLYDFFMQAPAGICALSGEDLVFEMINPGYRKILPKRELIGRSIFEALPELIGQPVEEVLRSVYRTGESRRVSELLVPLAEEEGGAMTDRYFTFNYLARRNPVGAVDGVLAFVYEVSEQVNTRRKIEESEFHFRQLSDLVPAKISNTDANGQVTFFNQQWLDFSGMSFEGLRDFGYHKMMHPDEVPEFQARLQKAAESGIPLEMEMRFMNTEGQYIWHLNIVSPILDEQGKIKMWVGSTTDIQKLKEEEQRKGDFVSMLSHELKTPVTSIKGHVQLLLRMVDKEENMCASGKLKTSLIRVDKLVLQLTNLIGDMLDLTRIESDRLELEKVPVSLNELVEVVVDDFRFTNQDHTINLVHELDCTVNVDKDKIGQVLINFISNAIKYAPDSHTVDVKVFAVNKGMAAVSVRDYGIGIDKKEHQKIFERFYRVEGKTQQYFSGFGIGLFLAQSIIQKHQGTVSVESEKGKGSVFTFTLLLDEV